MIEWFNLMTGQRHCSLACGDQIAHSLISVEIRIGNYLQTFDLRQIGQAWTEHISFHFNFFPQIIIQIVFLHELRYCVHGQATYVHITKLVRDNACHLAG
jgi:hypothetical protein